MIFVKSKKHASAHSGRLERWLGTPCAQHLSLCMNNPQQSWYGPPIHLLDSPGSVRACGDGDFIGNFEHGYFASALDMAWDAYKRAARQPRGRFSAGFADIGEALSQASKGFRQQPAGYFQTSGPTTVVGGSTSLHKLGPQPVAGTAASAAPGGRALVDSDTGGMIFTNPAAGTLRLTGADVSSSVISNYLLYDRIFDVAKTMASVVNEAVTGVPTRFQSSTTTSEDYAGGNFLFVEAGLTQLAATAHNWGVAGGANECLYRNQAGTDNVVMPVMVGNSGCIVHRLDHPLQSWFCPLASGDTGVKDLAQMRCSASVATGLVNFVIGHPIGFMSFPIINTFFPFDWLTNRDPAPYIPADAYLAFLQPLTPTTTAAVISGRLYATSTPS